MQENEWIDICKSLVEQKFQLPDSELWKQRNYQYLSDLIFEKTQVRLSISTLKRIWKGDNNRTPQLYTLNTLVNLLGFESWNDFKRSQVQETSGNGEKSKERKAPAKTRKKFYLMAIPVLLLAGSFAFFYFRPANKSFKENEIIFKSRKNVSSGVPNTVVFEYDISKADFDSAFIQQSWDQRIRARLSKDNHFQTFIYYYPGYHTAKLIIDNKIVKQEHINISTSGWEALVDEDSFGQVPLYIPKKDIINDNKLYVSKETLGKNEFREEGKKFYVNYFNVGKFKETYGENFTLETRLKNSLEEGAFVCQYCQLDIICENGMISIPFCNPGCAGNINLHVSDVFRDGKKNDLTAFGIDLSAWRDIKVKTVKKDVTIYIDGKPVYDLVFHKDLGKIAGFHYKFYGCGAVDMITLHNAKGELSYSDDFSAPVNKAN
jgi:hypothetical protein